MFSFPRQPNDLFFISENVDYVYVDDPHKVLPEVNILVTQTIAFTITKSPAVNNIKITCVIVDNVDKSNIINHTLALTENTQVIIIRNGKTSGHGGSSYVDPAAEVEYGNLTPAQTVTWTKGATAITLRAPSFGDKNKYEVVRVQRESRDKTLFVFQDPIWPKTESLSMTFTYMTEAQAISIMNFVRDTLGQRVDYYDQYGRHWSGYITNPDAELTQVGRKNWSISLEFQGVQA